MLNSLQVCTDKAVCGQTYSELAFQTAMRSGMWPRRPEPELVEGWITQALELSAPDSISRAKALIAHCVWKRKNTRDVAREASDLAERLADPDVRLYAWAARTAAAFADGDFEEAARWAQRRLDDLAQISDPDHVADVYEFAIPCYCAVGRLQEVRRLAAEHEQVVEPLSDHHRVHGVAVTLEVEEILGGWERILEHAGRVETLVEANLATPCIRNARSLLLTALAAAYTGDEDAARRYEDRAEAVTLEGYDFILAAPRTRLALLRGEVDDIDALIPPPDLSRGQSWFALQSAAARLDALAASRNATKLEGEAPPLLRSHGYLEPFALRALGIVREDEALLEQARAAFETLGLAWHADETGKLIAQA